MQSLAGRFPDRSGETVEAKAGAWRGERTVLFLPSRIDQSRRTSGGLGIARIPTRTHRDGQAVREQSAHFRRLSIRDESFAGQPSPCRGPDRTAKYYRFSEMEEPDGR